MLTRAVLSFVRALRASTCVHSIYSKALILNTARRGLLFVLSVIALLVVPAIYSLPSPTVCFL